MDILIFATNNQHKVDEVKNILGDRFKISSLKEAGIDIDIPEPHDNLEENAREKSSVIYNLTGKNCFSEDTGLEVAALNGAPGVKSARYAGDNADSEANINKLLNEMSSKNNREARFRTVISLIHNGQEHQFEGICNGIILDARKGGSGFGYDSVFVPEGSNKSFAEMEMKEKSLFSHRKKAMANLIEFLLHIY
ncbi:RdgB/HAM1 family non-canonical purine NTP pyrophosphatase [Ferruginibacter lapsinanis]|uniref:RdgB/HAM1 family non-canonical purine NTP pyrophosphatase n=1 Tax=Ferruginibacter lapsinanis TaxID=563172 RepID=UPI001E343B7D|nr:RdgB/HAM1 family non-canonical purine NTP pyrophosphatase [Ferruginibacter lapsinanis]UEG48525.1 RdgB/HAM1 family non-canonical purine NTP pyrophosphatase [Ferruginibacter lapsinanis]